MSYENILFDLSDLKLILIQNHEIIHYTQRPVSFSWWEILWYGLSAFSTLPTLATLFRDNILIPMLRQAEFRQT